MTEAGLSAAELPSRVRCGAGKCLLNGGIFVAVWVIVTMSIRASLPFPGDVSLVSAKYRYFSAHRDDYDVLFIGSSRFFHGIIPEQFDTLVAEQTGRRVHSFNIACDALWPPESFYFLRQILALHPARLKWVVIESWEIDPSFHQETEDPTDRDGYWHDLRHTLLALDALPGWNPPKSELRKHPEAPPTILTTLYRQRYERMHWRLLREHLSNFGRGARALSAILDPPSPKDPDWLDAAGYRPEPDSPLAGADLADFNKQVAERKAKLEPITMNPVLRGAVESISAEVRAAHAEPIFVISPTINFRENFAPLEGLAYLRFNDPNKYPNLFDPAGRYDEWHLNPKGAVVFTTELARSFPGRLPPGGEKSEGSK